MPRFLMQFLTHIGMVAIMSNRIDASLPDAVSCPHENVCYYEQQNRRPAFSCILMPTPEWLLLYSVTSVVIMINRIDASLSNAV